MHDPLLVWRSVTAAVAGFVLGAIDDSSDMVEERRDRGAVSIEQVLWYAAAAISVAVVAAIIWSQVRDTASTPVQSPSAP